MSILLGAIADDFTGATDLANVLTQNGMRVLQLIGVPSEDIQVDTSSIDAVIVALKSRTIDSETAVAWSLSALKWLQANGAQQILFKYCSTFDSSKFGNIGPVSDALLAALKTNFAFVCPAFPENGRTIYKGHLFVGDQLLSDSPMKDHPLTPMKKSNLLELMKEQSIHEVGLIPLEVVTKGAEAVNQKIDELMQQKIPYAVVDAVSDGDLQTIGEVAQTHALITGGSAVARGLPKNFRNNQQLPEQPSAFLPKVGGKKLVLAGSCSVATRNQIAAVRDQWPCFKIEVDVAFNNATYFQNIVKWAMSQTADTPLLIYASSDPAEVTRNQEKFGVERAGALVEQLMGDLAIQLVQNGFKNLVVAGGETSGAVVAALNIKALRIGKEITPGVPWTQSEGEPTVALALKSGNFGGTHFFQQAFQMLESTP